MSVVLAGLLAAGLAAGETAWPRVAPRDFTFAALMPVAPTVEAMHDSSFLGETSSTAYYSNFGDNRFIVSVTDIPRAAKWLAPLRVLFAAAKARLLEGMHAEREKSFTTIERDGVAGRRLLFESTPPDEAPRHGRAEFFYLDGKLLVAVGSHPHGTSSSMLERFFSGLRLGLRRCRDRDADSEPCRVDLALDD